MCVCVCLCVLKVCKYAYNCKLIFQIAVSAMLQCISCHVATTGSATNNQLVITLWIFNLHCKAIIFLTFNAYSSKHFYTCVSVCMSVCVLEVRIYSFAINHRQVKVVAVPFAFSEYHTCSTAAYAQFEFNRWKR